MREKINAPMVGGPVVGHERGDAHSEMVSSGTSEAVNEVD